MSENYFISLIFRNVHNTKKNILVSFLLLLLSLKFVNDQYCDPNIYSPYNFNLLLNVSIEDIVTGLLKWLEFLLCMQIIKWT